MKELICIVCPNGCHLSASDDGSSVTGAGCARGKAYAKKELTNPTRVLTSTVRVNSKTHRRLSVKTDRDIPKNVLMQAARVLDTIQASAPVRRGDILVHDLLGTGADVIATHDIPD